MHIFSSWRDYLLLGEVGPVVWNAAVVMDPGIHLRIPHILYAKCCITRPPHLVWYEVGGWLRQCLSKLDDTLISFSLV